MLNSCRFLSPEGFYLNATSMLSDMAPPGHWTERFYPSGPPASYNIILAGTDKATGTDYAVEYDCSDNALFGVNYWCVARLDGVSRCFCRLC